MNTICERCDTRCRLGMCHGKDGDFKYCFRPCGSIENIPGNIIPFNSIEELLAKNTGDYLTHVAAESLFIPKHYYGFSRNMRLLMGHWDGDDDNKVYPIGYVSC